MGKFFLGRFHHTFSRGGLVQLFIMIKRYVMTKEVIMLLVYVSSCCCWWAGPARFSLRVSVNIISFHVWEIEITRASKFVGIAFHRIPAPLFFCPVSGCRVRKYCRQLFCFLLLLFYFFTWNNDCINVGGRRRNMSARPPLKGITRKTAGVRYAFILSCGFTL